MKLLWSAAALALALLVPAARAADTAARLKQSSEDLSHVKSRMEAIAKGIEHDRGAQGEQQAAVEAAEQKIVDAQTQLHKLAADAQAQEARVHQAQSNRAAAERRLDAQKDLLARQLRSAYIVGAGGRAELLLSQTGPDRVDRLLTYFDYLDRASATHIAGIAAEVAAVQTEQQRYETELVTLQSLQTQRKRALAELEADRSTRAQAIAKLDTQIANESETLKHLQGNERELEALLEQLRHALAEAPVAPSGPQKAFPEMRGKLGWPLHGDILARYGEPKADSRLQWKGLWIAATEGAPVHASAHGRVAYVGWLSSYGLIIVIEHEKGFFTLYGHNASVAKAAGDTVAAGEIIAAVGNTGGYEKPGLYFEVRKGTESLDPKDWLVR